jgi:hypothetical protein
LTSPTDTTPDADPSTAARIVEPLRSHAPMRITSVATKATLTPDRDWATTGSGIRATVLALFLQTVTDVGEVERCALRTCRDDRGADAAGALVPQRRHELLARLRPVDGDA